MTKVYQAVNTLVLVSKVNKAEEIAGHLRRAGIAIQQNWVSSAADFSAALQREPFDLGIIYCHSGQSDIPAAVLRYPDTPFIVMLSQYRNRVAESLVEQGATDVVGFSHPVRLNKVLTRTIAQAKLYNQHTLLRHQFDSQNDMLHTLLRGTQEAISYLHQGMHSFSNPAYQRLTGLKDEDEALCTPLLDLVDPVERPLLDLILRQLENGQRDQAELVCQMQGPEGVHQPVALTLTKSWFEGESVLQLIAIPGTTQDCLDDSRYDQAAAAPELPTGCQLSNTQNLLKTARLHLSMEPINSLRADLFERHYVHLQHDDGPVIRAAELLQDDETGLTLIDLDRCIILEAMNQLATRLKHNPTTQFLIPLQAEATQHLGLTQWMQQHMQSRSIPARAVTLMMSLTGVSSTFAEQFELTRQMQLAGIGVCIKGISGTTEEQLYLSTSDIDYAILTPLQELPETQQLNQASYANIQKQLRICQQANVKTMIAASHPADITALWKLGVDCLIGDLEAQLDTALVC